MDEFTPIGEFSLDTSSNSIYTDTIREQLSKRHLIINQEINDSIIEDACIMILKRNEQDKDIPAKKRKKIVIFINSDGGDCISGDTLLSVIKASITPVITVGIGKCYSMASYILMAGTMRYAFKTTVTLIHDGMNGYVTSGTKAKDVQKFFDEIDEYQRQFIIDNTKITREFLEDNKERELYLWPDEAKEYGIVDKIIGVDCTLDEVL